MATGYVMCLNIYPASPGKGRKKVVYVVNALCATVVCAVHAIAGLHNASAKLTKCRGVYTI